MLSAMRPFLAAAALAAALAAPPARAVGPATGPDAPCACAAKKRCWNLVMIGYERRIRLSEEEVEKGLPNRFFPRTLTFVLRRPTEDGHFLNVECGSKRLPCTTEREQLERRLIVSSFLGSVLPSTAEGALFDPMTWRISDAGERAFAEVKSCRKGLVAELAAVVLEGGPD
jgi:hypothetical protein